MTTSDPELINNTEWLVGYAEFEEGRPLPVGKSYRLGWLAAKRDSEKGDEQ